MADALPLLYSGLYVHVLLPRPVSVLDPILEDLFAFKRRALQYRYLPYDLTEETDLFNFLLNADIRLVRAEYFQELRTAGEVVAPATRGRERAFARRSQCSWLLGRRLRNFTIARSSRIA